MSHRKWFPHSSDLADLTPRKVRDLITKCFFEAHQDRFAEASRFFGMDPSEDALYRTMEGIVRVAFRETNHDYDAPTRESLRAVTEYLVRKAAVWRAPEDVIEHNHAQITTLVSDLKIEMHASSACA